MNKMRSILSTFIIRITVESQMDGNAIRWNWKCMAEQVQTGHIWRFNSVQKLPGIIEQTLQAELDLIALGFSQSMDGQDHLES